VTHHILSVIKGQFIIQYFRNASMKKSITLCAITGQTENKIKKILKVM